MEINPIRIVSSDEYNPNKQEERDNDEITLPKIEEEEKMCEDNCMPEFDDIIEDPEKEEEPEEEETNKLFGKIKKKESSLGLPKNAFIYAAMALSLLKLL